ncbi:MAG: putative lipid II flippase FtsW [Rhizobiaceae bacterium]|nr:putative lipid II flippase FtsW [Rhizobiaceae bacterium]
MISRADNSIVAEWWRTIDKLMLGAVLFLMLIGMMLSFAASPSVAERIDLDSLHFIKRHALFLIPAVIVLIGASFLSPAQVRRIGLALFALSVVLLLATLFIGIEAKGSRRWLLIAGFSLQPSELIKPAFVIVTAWLFSENARRPDIPGNLFSIILVGIVCALLIAQPDFGQTMLVAIVWGAMFFLAGMSWVWIILLGLIGVGGIVAAYMFFPHVASRLDKFITGEGDNYQVETGLQAIVHGSWTGQGPGEGTVKRIIPDAHTDFPFAVAAEEFGILLAILLVGVFAFIVLRGLSHALRERDAYVRLATAGLITLFAIQSMIHLAVNLNLMPAKGMTLPFISYGGSSLVASALAMGFILALTRQRPEMRRRRPAVFRAGNDASVQSG